MKSALERPTGFSVVTLGMDSERVSRAAIVAAFSRVATQLKPDDTFLFYFSGHGFSSGGVSYLAPQEADVDDARGTCIALTGANSIQSLLLDVRARNIIVVLDSCRNLLGKGMTDSFSRDAKNLVEVPKSRGSYSLLMSCSEG